MVVLDLNGQRVTEFGENHPGDISAPCNVVVADDGTIFVADDDGDLEIWNFDPATR